MSLMNFLRALTNHHDRKCTAKERCRYRPSLESLEDRTAPATFTVTSDIDTPTGGSLREAITRANASPGSDTINFAITSGGLVKTINVLSPLPTLTGQVAISGNFLPGNPNTPLVQLNGALAGRARAAILKAAGSVVRS